jgi:uncharacterized glyoxalase superfamily protein PhnB
MGGEPAKMPTTSGPATAIPATAMRYRDVAAASEWLCSAFGFEKQTVLADDNGAPLYVQLTFGRAMLMLAPVRPSPIDTYMKQPDEIGGAETQSGYYVVADADAHYARAKAAGAAIVLEIEDDDFGGRTYTCRDPEGHIWTFGTYDPWQGKFPEPAPAAEPATPPPARGRGRRLVRAVLTLALMGGVGAAGWYGGTLTRSRAISLTAQAPTPAALERRAALEAAEQAARKALVELDGERTARAAADKASEQAQRRAAAEAQAREAAERAVKEVRAELEKVEAAKAVAASGDADLLKRVDEERRAREEAERAVKDARAELEKERAVKAAAASGNPDLLKRVDEERRAREAAERAAKDARAELEKAQSDKAAAELAKDFALNRAEEEQAAREAAERAAKEVRAELDRKLAVSTPVAGGPPPEILKGSADMQRTLDDAMKRAAAAESAVAEVREQLAKEKASKNAAWKVVGQLTKQLQTVKGAGADDTGDTSGDAPVKKAKPRPKKKAADSD